MRFTLILCAALVACATPPSYRKDVSVGYFGCGDKKGHARVECISSMLEELELIVSPGHKPVPKVVSSRRYDSRYVIVTTRTCFSTHFCVDETTYRNEPTLWYLVVSHIPTFLLAFVLGVAGVG